MATRVELAAIKDALVSAKARIDEAIAKLTPYAADKTLSENNTLAVLTFQSSVLKNKIDSLPS